MAPPPRKTKAEIKRDEESLRTFQRAWDAAHKPHKERCDRYEKCYDIYDAVLPAHEDKWRHNLHPPYALQIIEVIESNLVEELPRWNIRPLFRRYAAGAKVMERLIRKQLNQDRFPSKQPTFVRQGLITGLTVAKIPWVQDTRYVRRRIFEGDPFAPMPTPGVYQPEEAQYATVLETFKAQPSWVNVNVKNFLWDPAAESWDDCIYCCYRTYDTIDQLKAMEALGVYRNVDEVTLSDNPRQSPGVDELDLRGRVEVVECWWRDRLITVANKKVVLRDEPNPYHHGELPFVVASTMPRPFRIDGKSEVEILGEIQTGLWTLQNQRLDNVELINNLVYLVRDGMDNPEVFSRIHPGMAVPVSDPSDIVPLRPDGSIIGPAVQAEEILKGDLQNVSGAVPYLSGADQTTVDQTTATGVSMISNMATRRIMRKKQQLQWAYRDAGLQFIALNQQLMDGADEVELASADVAATDMSVSAGWQTILPQDIQGRFDFELEDIGESLHRQEKRSEALAKAQFLLGNAMGLAQMGVMIDCAKVIQDFSEAWDDDPNRFLVPQNPGFPGMGTQMMAPISPATPIVGGMSAQTTPAGNGAGPAPSTAA